MGDLAKDGEVLAIAVSFERVLEDGQRLSFGTAFAEDAPRAQKVRILDELQDLATRQASRARRPKLLAELRKHRETLAQFQEDAGRAEANWPKDRQALVDAIADAEDPAKHDAALSELRKEIGADLDTLRKRREDEYQAGVREHAQTGRVSDYKPRGHRAMNLERLDADLKKAEETAVKMLEQFEYDRLVAVDAAKAALTKAEGEREAVRGNYAVSIQRYTQAIDGLEEELAEIDDLLKD